MGVTTPPIARTKKARSHDRTRRRDRQRPVPERTGRPVARLRSPRRRARARGPRGRARDLGPGAEIGAGGVRPVPRAQRHRGRGTPGRVPGRVEGPPAPDAPHPAIPVGVRGLHPDARLLRHPGRAADRPGPVGQPAPTARWGLLVPAPAVEPGIGGRVRVRPGGGGTRGHPRGRAAGRFPGAQQPPHGDRGRGVPGCAPGPRTSRRGRGVRGLRRRQGDPDAAPPR